MPSHSFARPAGALLCLALALHGAPLRSMGGTLPSGLPGSFAFGSQSFPSGAGSRAWMDATKAANNAQWAYRYTYFNAGVNTGWGWSTWNAPAGQYATLYMNDSDAGGYIPVLVYYQMLQSNPATGADESAKDYNNLNNTSTMNAYYADYKLLLQKAAAFNKPVIIHIEPDLFGYIQKDHSSGSNNPANCSASVASSGHSDAAGLPNNFLGYCQALRRMRDTYAPQAKLAVHLSMWASGQDLMASTLLTQANIDSEVAETVSFLNACDSGSPGKFDLFFFEYSDRDASYKASLGQSWYWWSSSGTNIGGSPITFARQRYILDLVSTGLAKRGMGWQVPVGNTTYMTCNNATKHWRSPYAEYILGGYAGPGPASRIKDYANVGVIGMLFGAGMDDQTHPWDDAGDGITNGANVANYGSTQGSTLATVSDDDGGYLRYNVGNYHNQGTLPLSGAPTATPTSTRTPNWTATPTATPTPDCPRNFHLAEALSGNGVWVGANATRSLNTSAMVPAAISEGSGSIRAQINTTNPWWNADVLSLNSFTPSLWQPYNAISFDLYVDPAATPWTAGATNTKISVIGNSSAAGKWAQAITADADLVPGMNVISLPLNFGLGTLLASDALSGIQFVLKIDAPSTGVIYIDNIVLHTGGACPATATPSPTRTASPSGTPTRTPSATRTATLSATPSSSPSATPSVTVTPTETSTATPSRTPAGSPTPTATRTATASATPSASPSPSATPSPTPSASPSASGTATLSPSPSVSPSPSASGTPTASPSASPSSSPSSTSTASPTLTQSPTATATPSFSVSPTEVPTGSSPTASPTQTQSFTASPSVTATPSLSSTASSTSTLTLTATPSPSATPSASPADTFTASPTPNGSFTATPTRTTTPTGTPSSTVSPSATPSHTPVTGSPTPSPIPPASPQAGPVESRLLEAVAHPNPVRAGGPLVFSVKVQGQPRWLQFSLYTKAMVLVDSQRVDLALSSQPESWQRLPTLQAPLAAGLYHARFSAGGAEAHCKVFIHP